MMEMSKKLPYESGLIPTLSTLIYNPVSTFTIITKSNEYVGQRATVTSLMKTVYRYGELIYNGVEPMGADYVWRWGDVMDAAELWMGTFKWKLTQESCDMMTRGKITEGLDLISKSWSTSF